MSRTIRTSGNSRPWEFRPSAHRPRYHNPGPILPMELQPFQRSFLARLFGRG